MCVQGRLQKLNITNFKTVTGLGFSTLKNVTEGATLVSSGGLFLLSSLYVLHIKIFV